MINIASNLRALNYNIPPENKFYTKGIAGKIIPDIITTNSAVASLVIIELLKYQLKINDISKYKSTFINLEIPSIIYSNSLPAPVIDVGGIQLNSWTKFEYTKNTKLIDFKIFYENMFKTTIECIVVDSTMLYASFLSNSDSLDIYISDHIIKIYGSLKP
jgi:ubiquitin-activating enzyme E1